MHLRKLTIVMMQNGNFYEAFATGVIGSLAAIRMKLFKVYR